MDESKAGPGDSQAPKPSVQLLSTGLVRKLAAAIAVISIAGGAGMLYVDAGALLANMRRVPVEALLLATGLACANYAVRFARWSYYLGALTIRVPLGESVLVFLAGFAMSITPAKFGEVLKSLMLRDSHDVPLARSGPIVVAERLTDLVALLLLGGVGVLDLPHGGLIAALSVLVVALLVALVSWAWLWQSLVRLLFRIRSAPRLERKFLDMQESLGDLVTPMRLFVGTTSSLAAWALQGMSLAVVARSFPGVSLSFPHALTAYSAPVLAGTLALIPGGLGITEFSMAGALKTLGGPRMTSAVAAAVTILVRLATFWLALLLGFAALALWHGRGLVRQKGLFTGWVR